MIQKKLLNHQKDHAQPLNHQKGPFSTVHELVYKTWPYFCQGSKFKRIFLQTYQLLYLAVRLVVQLACSQSMRRLYENLFL